MNEPNNDEQVIAGELAALGEAPPSDDELTFVLGGAEARLDVDVLNVGTLVRIGHPAGAGGELLPLAKRRVWSVIADRAAAAPTDEVAHTTAGSDGRGVWRAVIGVVAAAAGVALVPRLTPPTDAPSAAEITRRRADVVAAGEAARAAVEALPGPVGSERARSLADAYAERLRAHRGTTQGGAR